jgi:hypothetical protein
MPERSLAHSCDNTISNKLKVFIGETILVGEAVLLAAYTALLGTKQRRGIGGTIPSTAGVQRQGRTDRNTVMAATQKYI